MLIIFQKFLIKNSELFSWNLNTFVKFIKVFCGVKEIIVFLATRSHYTVVDVLSSQKHTQIVGTIQLIKIV